VVAEIEKQKTRIGLVVVRTQPDSADVRVDGRLVGKAPLADPIRLTSGKHTIEATLPGYTTQARDLDVAGMARIEVDLRLEPVVAPESARSTVPPVQASAPPTAAVAPLEPQPATPPVVPPDEQKTHGGSGSGVRVLGYVLAGLGVIGVAAGGVIAITGLVQANDAKGRLTAASNAMPVTVATQSSWDHASANFNSAKNLNQLGWTVAGTGAAVAAGGVILVLIAPEQKANLSGTRIAPWITATSGGAAIEGAW
jgi:hypothetical protein